VNAAAQDRRFSLYRFLPGWRRQIPTRPLWAEHPGDERRTGAKDKAARRGLAGAAEDPAPLLFCRSEAGDAGQTAAGRTTRGFSMPPAEMELRPRQAPANTGLREVYINARVM
jgi:hypothetical protein